MLIAGERILLGKALGFQGAACGKNLSIWKSAKFVSRNVSKVTIGNPRSEGVAVMP
jgi:hypothetical protein